MFCTSRSIRIAVFFPIFSRLFVRQRLMSFSDLHEPDGISTSVRMVRFTQLPVRFLHSFGVRSLQQTPCKVQSPKNFVFAFILKHTHTQEQATFQCTSLQAGQHLMQNVSFLVWQKRTTLTHAISDDSTRSLAFIDRSLSRKK